ncbi:TlpA family protein disulfide reductase [Psychroflexus sp. ALD_RP9]|uniref:TlpA family protein disulfide reductase n=1 Tax=Psychroflexus sp. ALD_RP9 TaxID=2777186 RepID=UPI001A8E2FCF|nr:TlpA disulfide reductase family protein [Psychroflexus sp. ALD_RP9]QSS97216.1 TlpA family protein disulfide reductase [Psychroflexus sp. ALD_RP9]
MKNHFLLIFLFLLFIACQQQDKASKLKLTVNLSGDYPKTLGLKFDDKLIKQDVKNSQAIFETAIESGKSAELILNDTTSSVRFFIEPKSQSLNLLVDKISIGKLNYLESKLQLVETTKAKNILESFEEFKLKKISEKSFLDQFEKFKSNYPNHQVNGFILSELAYDNLIKFDNLQLLFEQTVRKAFTNSDFERFENYYVKRKKFQIGNPFYNFKLKNLENKLISKNDFKGKLLLIEFWSTWQAENALIQQESLLNNYRQNKAKGYEIIAISLNTNKSEWLKHVLGKQMPWVNLIAEQGFTSKITTELGITNLPQNFLVDQKGNIVAKNISIKELEVYQNIILN